MALNLETESPHNTFDVRIIPEVEWRLDRSLRSITRPRVQAQLTHEAKLTDLLTIVDFLDYPGSRLWGMYLADLLLYPDASRKC
jgi:hypothetical protein